MAENTKNKEFPREMVHNNVTFGIGDKVKDRDLTGIITGFRTTAGAFPAYIKSDHGSEGYARLENLTLIEKAVKK